MINTYPGFRTMAALPKPAQPHKLKHEAPHNLEDVIAGHQSQVDKMQERLKNYDDPKWIGERKDQLQQQITNLKQEISILQKLRQPAA